MGASENPPPPDPLPPYHGAPRQAVSPRPRKRERGSRRDAASHSWVLVHRRRIWAPVYWLLHEVDGGEGLAAELAVAGAAIEVGADGTLGDEAVALGGEALAEISGLGQVRGEGAVIGAGQDDAVVVVGGGF